MVRKYAYMYMTIVSSTELIIGLYEVVVQCEFGGGAQTCVATLKTVFIDVCQGLSMFMDIY